jgi:quercetin dioxygenase-like cupin family protein
VAPPPHPIAADLPGDLEGVLAAHAACQKARCEEKDDFPASAVADPGAPAAIWSYELAKKGVEASFPKRAEVDLYGVCVRGEATLAGAEAGAGKKKLGRWNAFRAPGAGVRLTAGSDGARVVLALVGDGRPIRDALQGKSRGAAAWTKRPAPVEVADLAAARDLAWAGGAMHARIAFEGPGQRASLEILMGSADAPVAQHTHDGSWEMLGVLRAEGTLRRAGNTAELAAIRIADGAIAAIAKGAPHAWEPDGTKPLVAVQLYVPPGPEQRFKQLAGVADATKP